MPEVDAVAHIVEQWQRERPDLDATPLLIVGQMARLTQLYDNVLRVPFVSAGLGEGEFDVLAALRRTGSPFTLTPGDLAVALLVTTGAVSKRLDRLERRGLIARRVSQSDGRGRLVRLTATGVSVTDELIGIHLSNEARLLAGLSRDERSQLIDLLAALARTFGQEG